MTDGRTRRVFVAMLREEWRMHSHFFRGSHFAAFPVVIAALTAGAAWLLVATGTDPGTVFAGLHALVFVFGLHTGSIGFVGRDALRNLLGDLTLLVFSARTLPLTQDRLLSIFVVKDLVYYAVLFLVPMSLGTVAAVSTADGIASLVPAAGTTLLLWTTLTLTFVLGMGATIATLGITRRGIPGITLLTALGVAIGAAVVGGLNVAAYTPYGVFLDQSLPRVGATLAALAGVSLVGALTFDTSARRSARTVGPSFRRWWRRIGDPVATKTLLDVHRSSGGFGKVLFSAAILLGVTASLVDLAGEITGVSPSVGVSFGAILGLSGFTTYNWLTQSDDVDSYRITRCQSRPSSPPSPGRFSCLVPSSVSGSTRSRSPSTAGRCSKSLSGPSYSSASLATSLGQPSISPGSLPTSSSSTRRCSPSSGPRWSFHSSPSLSSGSRSRRLDRPPRRTRCRRCRARRHRRRPLSPFAAQVDRAIPTGLSTRSTKTTLSPGEREAVGPAPTPDRTRSVSRREAAKYARGDDEPPDISDEGRDSEPHVVPFEHRKA